MGLPFSEGTWFRRLAGPHPWRLAAVAVVLAGLVAAFAFLVVHFQADSRHQAQRRFGAEAAIAAELAGSLFIQTATNAETTAAKTFAGRTVTQASLDALTTKAGGGAYMRILDAHGAPIASSADAPHEDEAGTAHVQAAVAGRAAFSDLLPAPAGAKGTFVEFAVAYSTPYGRRIEVEGVNGKSIFDLLTAYMTQAQQETGGVALILDSNARVVAGSSTSLPVYSQPKATGLVSALAHASGGSYRYNGADRYFVSAPVQDSTWRVVLTTTTNALYPALAGSQAWTLYLSTGVLALISLAGLVLLRRVFIASERLAVTNATLEERVAERTAAAEDRARELARSNEELEQFSSVASHDLQEPLRKIQMFGERLRDRLGDNLPEEPAADLQRMRDAAGRMQRLINDLLDFSRVTHRGKEFEPVDLGRVAREVVDDLEARIVELDADVAIGELPTIEADPTQMRQLIQNLIGNALKFHRPDVRPSIRVSGEITPGHAPRFAGEAANGARCVISVVDNGIGFEEKHAERVFDAFERLHARSAYDGTGIGLSIARKIAWRHGGHIVAQGRPNEGATFTVTLPITHSANGNRGDAT